MFVKLRRLFVRASLCPQQCLGGTLSLVQLRALWAVLPSLRLQQNIETWRQVSPAAKRTTAGYLVFNQSRSTSYQIPFYYHTILVHYSVAVKYKPNDCNKIACLVQADILRLDRLGYPAIFRGRCGLARNNWWRFIPVGPWRVVILNRWLLCWSVSHTRPQQPRKLLRKQDFLARRCRSAELQFSIIVAAFLSDGIPETLKLIETGCGNKKANECVLECVHKWKQPA